MEGATNVNEQVLKTRWSEAGTKLVGLAEAFPAERYDVKPTADVRSFAEQLRHVAFWNDWLGATLAGDQPDGSANELSASSFPDKPRIVQALRGSFQGVAQALDSGKANGTTAENALPILEHVAEHYGQLAVYCRMNGVVPPASRS